MYRRKNQQNTGVLSTQEKMEIRQPPGMDSPSPMGTRNDSKWSWISLAYNLTVPYKTKHNLTV